MEIASRLSDGGAGRGMSDQHEHGSPMMPSHEASPETPRRPETHSHTVDTAYRVTRPQLIVVAVASLVALGAGIIFSASYANLTLGTRDVGGLVMPPGMM